MKKIASSIPEALYKQIESEVTLGFYSGMSEAIAGALKKAYAEKSREYLRWFASKQNCRNRPCLMSLQR